MRTEQETKADKDIGVWHIRLACPRPSYFDPRDLCRYADGNPDQTRFAPDALDELEADIVTRVSDSSILEESLSAQITIQTFIQTQAWYTGLPRQGGQEAGRHAGLLRQRPEHPLRRRPQTASTPRWCCAPMAGRCPDRHLPKDVAVTAANCGSLVDKAVKLPG